MVEKILSLMTKAPLDYGAIHRVVGFEDGPVARLERIVRFGIARAGMAGAGCEHGEQAQRSGLAARKPNTSGEQGLPYRPTICCAERTWRSTWRSEVGKHG